MIAMKQVRISRDGNNPYQRRQMRIVESLKAESETLKDLDHPNVVRCLGVEEKPDWLSMWVLSSTIDVSAARSHSLSFLEYVPGGSIGNQLRKHGAFGDSISKSFTRQILNGLEYLHSKDIIHGVRTIRFIL